MKIKTDFKTACMMPAACLGALSFLSGCEGSTAGNVASDQKALEGTATKAQDGDMGMEPWALDIEEATVNNPHYRNAIWTGEHMQLVLMSLKPGEEIDLEMHENVDQFIRVEQGEAQIRMGKTEGELTYDKNVSDDWAVLIPAGYYHHVKNVGNTELKLYTIYTPAEHPKGTVHKTYEEARKHHAEHDKE